MKRGYLKSSPHFFRLIGRALGAFTAALLLLSYFVPAPLQEPANIARVPNPVKSAWFLLWIQELVSYSSGLINLVLLLALALLLLPWFPRLAPSRSARWFPGDQRWVNVATLLLSVAVLALTVTAMFLRGENWALTAFWR